MGLILLSVVLFLTACSDDGVEGKKTREQKITVLTGMPSFLEVSETPTRALPYGYIPYSSLYPVTPPDNATIGIILAEENTFDQSNYSVTLDKNPDGSSAGSWTAVINVQEGGQYYVYGFMPREEAGRATIEKLPGDESGDPDKSFSFGCKMTINNLNTLTSGDVCAVVAVRGSTEAANITDLDPFKLGKFEYSSNYPYLFLLLKHLYAGLHFKAHIDTDYAKLRTIKVKNMTLKTVDMISDQINLCVTIEANENGTDPITDIRYTDVATSSASYNYAVTQLFPTSSSGLTEFELPTQTTEEFLSCFAPGKCGSFDLTTIYDVYDKKGNLIRKDCKAVNRIEANTVLNVSELQAGEIYTIDLKVEPTYLYVLSDPDIDNPTFRITGE